MHKLSVSYKKTLHHLKTDEQAHTNVQNRIQSYQFSNKAIIYIDKSGFAHDMSRTHGYGYTLKGTRCYGKQNWECKGC